MTYPNRLIDKRVVDRYIAKGMVDREKYQSLIDGLPDVEHNAIAVLQEEEEPEAATADEGASDADAPISAGETPAGEPPAGL